jgi:flavin-dependent dehydrogenase
MSCGSPVATTAPDVVAFLDKKTCVVVEEILECQKQGVVGARGDLRPSRSGSEGSVLFVGDAAGMINPLSGEGIYYALATGRLAGTAAVLHTEHAAAVYESSVNRLFRAHFRSTGVAHRLQRLPRNIDAAVAAADRSWPVFEDLVELALGRGTLTAWMTAGIARRWLWP